jgi:hypothetical protein
MMNDLSALLPVLRGRSGTSAGKNDDASEAQ